MPWLVYKHTAPNGKVYIGITHQKPESRWRSGEGYQSNTHFYRAICKYGWDNFLHEIIADNLTEEEATERETNLIEKHHSADRRYGYNVALGGHVLSEESRKKIGFTRKLRGMSSPTTGKHLSDKTREKISKAHTGRHYSLSEKARENIRSAKLGAKNPNYGKGVSELAKQKRIEVTSIAVVRKGDPDVIYKSAAEASRATGVSSCNICRVCKGKRETAGGFKWEYVGVI